MRTAIMGAGAVGAYLGGMLAQAGHPVALIARGQHLTALRQHGLRVIRDRAQFTVQCPATDNPAEIGPVDLALLTVKTYQNPAAVPAMAPIIGPDTAILCLQNGIDSYQAPASAFGADKVLPGAIYIEAALNAPGIARQTGDIVRIVFGELSEPLSARAQTIAHAFNSGGIPAEIAPDIHAALWAKFLFIATMAGVTSIARQTLAQLMPRPEWRPVVTACLREIEAAGRANGVNLPPDIHDTTLAYIENNLADLQASMHTDLIAGRPLELDALTGAVIRAGRAAAVPTPVNDIIYALLQPLAAGVSSTPTL